MTSKEKIEKEWRKYCDNHKCSLCQYSNDDNCKESYYHDKLIKAYDEIEQIEAK